MSLTPGARLGPYEIVSALGAGGMGEVYRARDARLKRDVAIKVLPEAFAQDPERLGRFQREAELLAALNHPNIAAIYGLEDRALVLELVEGPTLADRIAHGALPLDEALPIARQIADALDAAHEQGVIHRDLKPANVKVRPDGTVKVLDFGLAKLTAPAGSGSSPNLSNSPTMMASVPGTILGTAAYMSPEQARGNEADRASDVWAFGCVLYEMLTGRRAFPGDTVGDIVANVLKAEPDWQRLPAGPECIRRLLRRCLEKDPKRRLRDIRDARLELDEAQTGPSPHVDDGIAHGAARSRVRSGWLAALVALAALVVLAGAVLSVRALRTTPASRELRLEINTPASRDPSLSISPDGLKIVYVARSEGPPQLWLRALDSSTARPLAGTEFGFMPFWSPDSRSIAFFADTKLKRMEVDGGSVRTLTSTTPVPGGGSWNRDGTIVFAPGIGTPLLRISSEGGESAVVTTFQTPQQRSQGAPRFLPDGRHFLFFVTGSAEASGVYIGQLDGLDTRRLFGADTPADYASTGHLLFTREGQVRAWAFDPVRLELSGVPFPLGEPANGGTRLSTSAAGPIVFRTPATDRGQRQLVWTDRSGRAIDTVMYPDTSGLGPALAHDGRHVALFRYADGNMDIWQYDVGRRTWDRVTFDSGDDIFALWSPDDRQLVFGSSRMGGRQNLYRKALGGAPGSEERLLETPEVKFATDWSSDGRFVLYDSINSKRGFDIWALPLEGDRKPFEVIQTDFNERMAQFSPDGKWIAYQSDKTGRYEIYVQPFPGSGGGSRVSTDGGTQVRWNRNARELFYVGADDRLMAVPIRFGSNGTSVEPGTPLGLFATNVGSTTADANRHQYMVSPDGQSFVLNSAIGEAGVSPISVILNWKPQR